MNLRIWKLTPTLALAALLAACSPPAETQSAETESAETQSAEMAEEKAEPATPLAAGKAFLAENGKREGVTTTASGLQYEVLASGDGPSPKRTDTVTAHYHGTLIDGRVFDSSVEKNRPFTTRVDGVIMGWQEVLPLMRVGDKWKVFIPSELAYGEHGAGTIGAHETLIFEMELLAIEGQDATGDDAAAEGEEAKEPS